jgi:hypothetical protein
MAQEIEAAAEDRDVVGIDEERSQHERHPEAVTRSVVAVNLT